MSECFETFYFFVLFLAQNDVHEGRDVGDGDFRITVDITIG